MAAPLTLYTTSWCPDCHRAKRFLEDRDVAFEEVDIDEDEEAEQLVIEHNEGRRRVPTFEIDGAYYGNPSLQELGALVEA